MRGFSSKTLLLLISLSFQELALSADALICGEITLRDSSVSFTAAEKRLLCGDAKDPVWNAIPRNQAIFHLRSFLSARGYHQPTFEPTEKNLVVSPGEISKVKHFEVKADENLEILSRVRGIEGEVLAAPALDKAKKLLTQELSLHGYPCPEVDVEAIVTEARVTAKVKVGPFQKIKSIDADPMEGLLPGIFSRYYAFHPGDTFSANALQVTTQRILERGLVHSTHFTSDCTKDGAQIKHHFFAGPPRLWTIGVGADSEHAVIARTTWKNSRLGPTASILTLSAFFSFLEQELKATADWYVLPKVSRFHLTPELSIKHENKPGYESYRGNLSIAPSYTWDWDGHAASVSFGPMMDVTGEVRGASRQLVPSVALAGKMRYWTHDAEAYRTSPRSGHEVELGLQLAKAGWLSSVEAQVIRLKGERHWNLRDFLPPLFILSVRGSLITTFAPGGSANPNLVAPTYRHFLGGSQDLRGYSIQEIGKAKGGVLTTVYGGVEGRFADLLPFGIQPIVFTDVGMVGTEALSLTPPVFLSPGLGVRFESPIGVFRLTGAQGFTVGPMGENGVPGHFQFYFSYGEEF